VEHGKKFKVITLPLQKLRLLLNKCYLPGTECSTTNGISSLTLSQTIVAITLAPNAGTLLTFKTVFIYFYPGEYTIKPLFSDAKIFTPFITG
jgi:hypothetical protein